MNPIDPSPELSYTLGVYYGDGSASQERVKRTNRFGEIHRIRLSATDRDFVEEFNRCISKVLGREPNRVSTIERIDESHKKIQYQARYCSKLLYDFLKGDIDNHKLVVERCPADFIRGFFDSEGGAYLTRGHVVVKAYNTNVGLLEYIKELLWAHFSIYSCVAECQSITKDNSHWGNKPMFYLLISSQDGVKKYRDHIGFAIARKMDRLRQANFPLLRRLQKYREAFELKKRGLNHTQISRILKVSRSTIVRWIHNKCRPDGRISWTKLDPQ